MAINYYIVDTETTGLSPEKHEVFEISIIRCSDRMQLTKRIVVEHPETATAKALEVTNTTLEDLKLGQSKESAVDECIAFFEEDGCAPEERCITGHNIYGFDKKFLHALWRKCDKKFPANLWLDTLTYIRKYADSKNIPRKGLNLTNSCKLLGINPLEDNIHSAKVDTRNNYLLLDGLRKTGISQVHIIKREPHIL